MKNVVIVCETDGCENKGQIINEVELLDCDLDEFMEAFGVSDYEMMDCCDKCGKLGVAKEEPEYRNEQEAEYEGTPLS